MENITAIDKEFNAINKTGQKEGWGVFYTGDNESECHNIYELQRLDEARMFKSDVDAVRSVSQTAIERPRSIHARAVKFLAEHSPNEIDSIFRIAIGKEEFERLLKVLKIEL